MDTWFVANMVLIAIFLIGFVALMAHLRCCPRKDITPNR